MSHPPPALGDDLKREGEGKAGSGVRCYHLGGHWNGFPETLPLKPALSHLIWPFRSAHLAVLAGLFCASAHPQRLPPLPLPPHPTPSLQKPLLAGAVSARPFSRPQEFSAIPSPSPRLAGGAEEGASSPATNPHPTR